MGNEFKKDTNKFELFKDKKQAILAIVVLLLFGFSLINMFSKLHPNNDNNQENLDQQITENINNENSNIDNADAINPNLQEEDNNAIAQDAQNIYNQTSNLQEEDNSTIDIMAKKSTGIGKGKRVLISVQDGGRENPFKPSSLFNQSVQTIEKLPLPLIDPPVGNEDSVDQKALTVMKTSVSGILYDQYSPSAILNLKNSEGRGSDYLVSVGDTLNGYKILGITKTKVTVKLGNNIYIAGVGEYLKKSELDSSKNLSNMNHKFGGNSVTIRVKKQ